MQPNAVNKSKFLTSSSKFHNSIDPTQFVNNSKLYSKRKGDRSGVQKKNDYLTYIGLATKKKIFYLATSLFFDKFVAIFGKKNMALLVQKFCGDFILSEFVSGYFKTKKWRKKVPFSTELKGGGKALVTGPLNKITFFCGFPYEVLFDGAGVRVRGAVAGHLRAAPHPVRVWTKLHLQGKNWLFTNCIIVQYVPEEVIYFT